MKKMFNGRNFIGKKSIILIAVSLILVAVTAVSATASWIEEVSQVEFSTNSDSQQTPLHVGEKILKADANMANENQVVNLNEYFYKAGDMHLSPCYSDGEKFYFPVAGKNNEFREGTKDDANVSYMSATFRINSIDANTAYWFEKTGSEYVTFKKGGTSNSNYVLRQYLRCSVTIDGATNVYAMNSTGEFKKLASSTATSETTVNGRKMSDYTYYTESFSDTNPEEYYKNDANKTNKPNQGGGDNLNGNTLFTVNKFDNDTNSGTKVVTVKLWLEYNGAVQSIINSNVDIASVNINFVSSWAKTRRVYVKDATVNQVGYNSAKWLTNESAKLYFAEKDNLENIWPLEQLDSTDFYYADIPAVYNNTDWVLFRSKDISSNTNDQAAYTKNGKTVYYRDKWETTFPDTFHSETYTVYSKDFATWEPANKVHSVYIVNSAFFSNMYDYMWDHNSEHGTGINEKVVKNANWPGIKMNVVMNTKTNSQSLDTYAFFYNSDYDRIIFNDGDLVSGQNQEYQTQDLHLTDSQGNPLSIVNGTFDMATLTWFHTNPTKSDWNTKMPSYSGNNTYIHGNFSTNNAWKDTRFAYGGEYSTTTGDDFKDSSSTHMLCKIYCKSGNDYEFILRYNGKWLGAWKDGDKRVTPDSNLYIDDDPNDPNNEWTKIPTSYGLTDDDNHRENFTVKGINAGDILRIYFDTNDMTLYFAKGENTHY